VRVERWPIAGTFSISRGAKTEAVVVVAELSDRTHRGRGECVPYARYGETVDGVAAAIEGMRVEIGRGLDRERLQSAMAPGATRARLRVLGPGGNACRPADPRAAWLARAQGCHPRLHDLARHAGSHGEGRCRGRRAGAAQDQARRARRSRADCGGAARRAAR